MVSTSLANEYPIFKASYRGILCRSHSGIARGKEHKVVVAANKLGTKIDKVSHSE